MLAALVVVLIRCRFQDLADCRTAMVVPAFCVSRVFEQTLVADVVEKAIRPAAATGGRTWSG